MDAYGVRTMRIVPSRRAMRHDSTEDGHRVVLGLVALHLAVLTAFVVLVAAAPHGPGALAHLPVSPVLHLARAVETWLAVLWSVSVFLRVDFAVLRLRPLSPGAVKAMLAVSAALALAIAFDARLLALLGCL